MGDRDEADQATLYAVLQDIQVLARFSPYRSLPYYKWWVDELAKSSSLKVQARQPLHGLSVSLAFSSIDILAEARCWPATARATA